MLVNFREKTSNYRQVAFSKEGNVDTLDLLILDGRHLLWRAASVFGDLSANVSGEDVRTGGMYGFLRISLACWVEFGGITFVAWDHPRGPTTRRMMFDGYKGHRNSDGESSDDPSVAQRRQIVEMLREQEAGLRRLLPIIGIRQADAEGWEADDVIATLCSRFKSSKIGILSGDRDLLQLVNENVSLIRPIPRSKFKIETPESVKAELGITPEMVLDMKALAGDASDHIPGARGIGQKTAIKLLLEHGKWHDVLDWAMANKPEKKWHQSLIDSAADVRLSAALVNLNRAVHIKMYPANQNRRRALLELAKLKFHSLMVDARRHQLFSMGMEK